MNVKSLNNFEDMLLCEQQKYDNFIKNSSFICIKICKKVEVANFSHLLLLNMYCTSGMQGWEFSHFISEQIARFLSKN